jgi:hypothetical protein
MGNFVLVERKWFPNAEGLISIFPDFFLEFGDEF